LLCIILLFFFFQAEDGIRDRNVTGVQTCALPISCGFVLCACLRRWPLPGDSPAGVGPVWGRSAAFLCLLAAASVIGCCVVVGVRSEERRVGKGWRGRWGGGGWRDRGRRAEGREGK